MTREEAFVYAIAKKAELEVEIRRSRSEYGDWAMYSRELDFIATCISALRGPTREMVEKMKTSLQMVDYGYCGRCGAYVVDRAFCSECGSPLTDAAVDILAKRLEEVQHENRD